jgi:small redox-active disulfide protein 2
MKKIQILGPGCPRCEKLAELTDEVARSTGIEYELEKVTDIQEIVKFGVMITPALVVDGQVKMSGKVPAREEIEKMLLL